MPADKGKAEAVMDKMEYNSKYLKMVSNTKVYQKLKSDPTPVFKWKLIAILTRQKDEEKITQAHDYHHCPTSDMTPRLYGSPKVHKECIPLQPIMDYTGSVVYNVSRSLADLLKHLVRNTEYVVKNTALF